MRTTSSTGSTQILPSPIFPVRAASVMTSMMRWTSSSSHSSSMRALGTKSILYSVPRYTSVCPAWRPNPCTSVTVMPFTSACLRASFTSSSLNGLMMAVISFIGRALPSCVGGLGVLRQVEARVLVSLVDAQPDGGRDHPRQHVRHDERERDRRADRDQLVAEQLAATAREHTIVAGAVDGGVGEEAEQQRSEDAADEVHRDHVERVVDAERALDRDGEEADTTG